jgi:hypothetical protein
MQSCNANISINKKLSYTDVSDVSDDMSISNPETECSIASSKFTER